LRGINFLHFWGKTNVKSALLFYSIFFMAFSPDSVYIAEELGRAKAIVAELFRAEERELSDADMASRAGALREILKRRRCADIITGNVFGAVVESSAKEISSKATFLYDFVARWVDYVADDHAHRAAWTKEEAILLKFASSLPVLDGSSVKESIRRLRKKEQRSWGVGLS